MDIEKIKERAKELRNDTINVVPIDIDWRERLGEDCEGWQSFDHDECSECGEVLVGSWGEQKHSDADYESDCEGYLNFSEPMMNCYYPLPNADHLEPDDVKKIDGPVVLIQFEDGDWALALSGGGMDLSWDICKAFVDLGFLPPTHFADLPEFAGDKWTEGKALVVCAMGRSLEIAELWLQRKQRHLEYIEKYLKKNLGDSV